jgi:hypothetical protein
VDLEMNTRRDLKKRVEALEAEISELKSQLSRLTQPVINPCPPIYTQPITLPNTWPVWTPSIPYIGDLPNWQQPVTTCTTKSFEAQAQAQAS